MRKKEENTTVVIYSPQKESPKRKGNRYINGVKLVPYRNVLYEAQLARIKEDPYFSQYVKEEIVEILDDKVVKEVDQFKKEGAKEKGGVLVITDFTVAEATKIVTLETDSETLRVWYEQERLSKQRKTILDAIVNQLKTVRAMKD